MKTIEFLKKYLEAIDIQEGEYEIEEKMDTIGYLITLKVKKTCPKVGILKGKRNKNLLLLKRILRIVGLNEKINPFLIFKLI